MENSFEAHKKKKAVKEKRDIIDRLLEQDHVLLHIDATKEGLDIPEHLLSNPQLVLKISRRFMGNLYLKQELIETELLFGEANLNYLCKIPYDCIWGATSAEKKTLVWPQDLPEILAKEVKKNIPSEKTEAKSSPVTKPELKQAAPKKESSGKTVDTKTDDKDKPKKTPHLKLVK